MATLLGTPVSDDALAALGLLGGHMVRGDFGGGLLAANGYLNDQPMKKLQMQDIAQQIKLRDLQAAQMQRQADLVMGALGELNGTTQTAPSIKSGPAIAPTTSETLGSGTYGIPIGGQPAFREATGTPTTGGGLVSTATALGIPRAAISTDIAFNGGKGLSDMIYKQGTPKWENVNGNLVNTNAPGFSGGIQPGLKAANNGQMMAWRVGPTGEPEGYTPKGALDAYAGYMKAEQDAKAAADLVQVYEPNAQGPGKGGMVYKPRSALLGAPQQSQATTQEPTAPAAGITNPGNLRPAGASTGFQSFSTPEEGLAALDKNLQAYGKKGLNTVTAIITKWAPPSENDTQSYIADVSKRLGIKPDQPLDLNSPLVRQSLSTAIALHEHGPAKVFAAPSSTAAAAAPTAGPSGAPLAGAPIRSEGQKAVDEAFAKDYAQWVAAGGFSDTNKQLQQLDLAKNELEQAVKGGKTLTGPVIGKAPDSVLSFTNPDAIRVRNMVEETVQRNLRAVLGAQFTENEGKMLIARAYNPQLPEAENLARVNRLIDQIKTAAATKADAAKYFEANGSLSGWKGKLPTFSDFNPEPREAAGKVGAAPTGWAIKRMP